MSGKLISICIPTYNRPKLVREAVDSAIAQSYQPLEILVSDDSRNDDTETALGDLIVSRNIRYVRNSPPLGQAGNVNNLFDRAKGELLVLLHDDDILLPDAVANLVASINPRIATVYGKQYIIDEGGNISRSASEGLNLSYRRTPEYGGVQHTPLFSGVTSQFPNDGYLVRTDLARSVRYRDEPAVGDACDLDFGLRLSLEAEAQGLDFYYLDSYTCKYRVTGEQISSKNRYHRLTYDLLQKFPLPKSLEGVRQERLEQHAQAAVTEWLETGDRSSARKVFLSSAYGWRRRVSAMGMAQLVLLAIPVGVSKRLIRVARSCGKLPRLRL